MFAAWALGTIALTASSPTGYYFEEVQQIAGGPVDTRITIASWHQGDMLRRTFKERGLSVIVDYRRRRATLVNDRQHTYLVLPERAYREIVTASLAAFGVVRGPDGRLRVPPKLFEATGRTAKVGRWRARELRVVPEMPGGGRATVWVADGVGLTAHDLVRNVRDALGPEAADLAPFFAQLEKLGGYPVRSQVVMQRSGRTITVTQELTYVDRRAISPSLFVVPEGYTQVTAPAAGGAGTAAGAGRTLP